jgi:hypothetical protein
MGLHGLFTFLAIALSDSLKSGFKKAGIYPLTPDPVMSKTAVAESYDISPVSHFFWNV